MKAQSKYKYLSRLRTVVQDYQSQTKAIQQKIEQNQNDYKKSEKFKEEEDKSLNQMLQAEKLAAKRIIAELREDYKNFACESASPLSFTESGTAYTMTDGEIRFLKSLDYVSLSQSDYVRLTQHYDPRVAPGICSAIRKKAEQDGYKISGWYETAEEMTDSFNRMCDLASQIVEPPLKYRDSADLWSINHLDTISEAAENAFRFDENGRPKPSAAKVTPIPKTPEEEIIQMMTKEEKPLTLKEEAAIVKEFGEDVEPLLMAEGIKNARNAKFERDFSENDIDG